MIHDGYTQKSEPYQRTAPRYALHPRAERRGGLGASAREGARSGGVSMEMLMSALLVAIDPGPHTGIACRLTDDSFVTIAKEHPGDVWSMLKHDPPKMVACETFYTGGRIDIHMLRTIEMVGGVKAVCHMLQIPLFVQQPQERTAFLDEARALLGEYYSRATKTQRRAAAEHELDALAHLLLLEWRLIHGKLDASKLVDY